MKILKHRLFSGFLAVFLSLGVILQSPVASFAENGHAVDQYIDKSGISFYKIDGATTPIIENGIEVDNPPTIKVSDQVKLRFEFQVDSANMPQIHAGDYFTLQLPAGGYLDIASTNKTLLNESGEVFANYTIENGQITVTFTETGANQPNLESGFIEATGHAAKAGDLIIASADGDITITIQPGNPSSGGGNGVNDSGNAAMPSEKLKFTKDGKQYNNQDKLNWHFNVNYDGLRQMVSNQTVTPKHQAVIVDTLPADIEFDASSVYITAPIFVPTPAGDMSGYAIGYQRIHPIQLTPTTDEDTEAFIARVKSSTSPAFGIINQQLFFAFGELPGNNQSYDQNYLQDLVQAKIQSGDITQSQGEQLLMVYGANGPTVGQIVGYDVSYDTIVTGDSGNYHNHADFLTNNENQAEASDYIIAYNSTSGGISSSKIQVSVNKIWQDADNQDGSRPSKIYVQLYANDLAKYEPVMLSANNDWSYQWQNLPKTQADKAIDYRVAEVSQPDDYTVSYEQTQVGNQISVTITNTKTVDVFGEKIWQDHDNTSQTRPNQITVQLCRDDKVLFEQTVSAHTNWQFSFTNLTKYRLTGQNYIYSIFEKPVTNYQSTIQGSIEDGFAIINTLQTKPEEPEEPKKPEEPEEPTMPTQPEKPNQPEAPNTADPFLTYLFALIFSLFGFYLSCCIIRRQSDSKISNL